MYIFLVQHQVSTGTIHFGNIAGMTNPTLVLVHGAWHSPDHFKPLIQILESHKYKAVGVTCPSSPRTATTIPAPFEDDCEAIRSIILRELDSANVLVIAHSYGGVPASNALRGLSPPARAASNHTTAVTGIAYISAAAIPAGTTFLQALGGQPKQIHDLSAKDGFARVGESGSEHYFYNDLPADEAKHWA